MLNKICASCAKSLPKNTRYAVGAIICNECASMAPNLLVAQTLETCKRNREATHSAKAQRQAQRMVLIATKGKRCDTCHAWQRPAAFAKCAPKPDGLQPTCRSCFALRSKHMRQGGTMTDWYAIRAGMRAQNANAPTLDQARAAVRDTPEHPLVAAWRQAGTDTDRAALRTACESMGLALPE